MNETPLDLATVGRTLRALLEQGAKPIVFHDRASGQNLAIDLDTAVAPAGLLPAFLAAGAAVWRDATGQEFGLVIARDADALLGYRVQGVRGDSFSAVMLSVMEATAQVTGPEAVLVNGFGALWSAAAERAEHGARIITRPSTDAAP